NGLQFVVVERHDSPAVSFHTYVRAGSADDGAGRTGLAWLLEEALFTGTETIGSKNWAEEKKAMDAIETAYDEIEAERNLGARTSQDRIDPLQSQLRIASEAAGRLGMRGSYTTLLDENGGTRPSVSTSPDGAECTYTMPSNRVELWFLLESQRLMRPVFRDFYGTRDAAVADRERRVGGPAVMYRALAAGGLLAASGPESPDGRPGARRRLAGGGAQAFSR